MKAIYEPKGAALEYAPLACNLFRGCMHGCRYCYVPGVLRMDRQQFHAETEPRPGILEALERDAKALNLAFDTRPVHLCFTCDPFGNHGHHEVTRNALDILNDHDRSVIVLTKGALHASDWHKCQDADCRFGVSLVWADDAKRAEWEPHAASVAERVNNLRVADGLGLSTWVSMEPVIEPDECMAALELVLPYADVIKVGRWNHDKRANGVDWQAFARRIKAQLVESGKPHVLKRGLVELL